MEPQIGLHERGECFEIVATDRPADLDLRQSGICEPERHSGVTFDLGDRLAKRLAVEDLFGMKRLDWAMGEVICLWLMIAALIAAFAPFSAPAAPLLAPYLAWVSVAAALNFRLLQLNGPRGSTPA